uniref:Uncharacterized protein n=1 Tax=Panagrolaimus davidi TaxID=227884 RepID=A0A914PZ36_9BILA
MTRKSQQEKYVTLFIGIFIFLCIIFYFNKKTINSINPNITDDNKEQQISSKLSLSKLKFDICMIEAARIYYKEATKFFEEFSYCIKAYISIDETEMDNFSNSVLGERKMFLPMSNEYSQEKCKWLTVGVGGVTAAEEIFKEKYPKCSVFGVEPADAGNFSKIGKLIPFGAGKF